MKIKTKIILGILLTIAVMVTAVILSVVNSYSTQPQREAKQNEKRAEVYFKEYLQIKYPEESFVITSVNCNIKCSDTILGAPFASYMVDIEFEDDNGNKYKGMAPGVAEDSNLFDNKNRYDYCKDNFQSELIYNAFTEKVSEIFNTSVDDIYKNIGDGKDMYYNKKFTGDYQKFVNELNNSTDSSESLVNMSFRCVFVLENNNSGADFTKREFTKEEVEFLNSLNNMVVVTFYNKGYMPDNKEDMTFTTAEHVYTYITERTDFEATVYYYDKTSEKMLPILYEY